MYFSSIRKAISILTVALSFCILCHPVSAKSFVPKQKQTKFSSLTIAVSTESLIVSSPVVPIAFCVAKSNNRANQGFNNKDVVHTFFYSSYDSAALFSYHNPYFFYGKNSLRLHLTLGVIRI